MIIKKVTINNPSGIHMRPAGIFMKLIKNFTSDVIVHFNENEYNAKSVLDLLRATIKCGDVIELRVNGEDEEECMNSIVAAIESGLGE